MAQETRPLVEGKYLEYLDKPLVREENTICYGDKNDKCILIFLRLLFLVLLKHSGSLGFSSRPPFPLCLYLFPKGY